MIAPYFNHLSVMHNIKGAFHILLKHILWAISGKTSAVTIYRFYKNAQIFHFYHLLHDTFLFIYYDHQTT